MYMKLYVEAFKGHETEIARVLFDLRNKDKSEIKIPIKKYLPDGERNTDTISPQ